MSPFRSSFVPRLFTLVAVVLLGACGGPSAEEDARVCLEVECTAGRCVAENGAPVCRCGAFEEAAGLTCAIAAFRPSDDHGDTVETATLLAHTTDFQEGDIHPLFRNKVDHDVFALPPLAGHGFRFTLRPGTLTAVSWQVLDARGRRVYLSALRTQDGEVLELVSTPEAPRFIEVFAATGREGSGTYTYRLEDLGKDAHGDTLATATPIAVPSTPFPVALEFAEDSDVFTFRNEPGHGFRFSCESEVSVTLWDSTGAQVQGYQLDIEGRTSVGRLSQEASTWYVRVYKGSSVFSTQCQLDDLGPDEHANGMPGATPLPPGVPVTARLQGTNDVDVFSFEATQGHIYTVGVSPARQHRIQLTDAAGKVLVETAWGSIVHEAASTGRYFVHVLQDAHWWSDFQVELKDLGPDDHGGTPETATRVEVGQSVEGLIHKFEDLDAISLHLDADGVYQVTCMPDCSMRMSASSDVIRMHKTSLGVWKAHLLASALVTFLIDSRSPPYAFTFRVERVGTDDHGDDAAHATLVTLPVSLEGVFELGTDLDELAVTLEGGTTYVVSSSGANVRLFDAGGANVPVVYDAVTRTQRVTTTAPGRHRVVLSSPDPLVGIARSWHFALSAP